MARIFATPEQLAEWTGDPAPANAVGLLRTASGLISRSTRTAIYATTPAGLPSAPKIAEAFRDAATAQAAFWAANKLDPAGGSLTEMGKGHATSKSIKGASVGYSVTLVEKNNQARTDAVNSLCEEAWTILDNEGLVNQPLIGY